MDSKRRAKVLLDLDESSGLRMHTTVEICARSGVSAPTVFSVCKENGLNPFEYLVRVLQNAPNWDIRNDVNALERLLPFNQGALSASG